MIMPFCDYGGESVGQIPAEGRKLRHEGVHCKSLNNLI